ncbi:putative UDP-glycosyltransferase 87A2 isoform X1 [Iris pallida]|uniref:Glycosyltransferase n=1 Tax=Iris pallida TaxID=29817 RepID=A0AAX6GPE5_IRIPA|nr:putative UDP-glycosyltransferase 87A2 isoform X1 [Iris pallida]
MNPNPQMTKCCHFVAVPFPGRGHVNAMMSLCRIIASKSTTTAPILITYVVTDEWLGFLLSELHPLPPNVRLASIPNVIPSELGRAKHYEGFIDAVLTKMPEAVERLLDRLEPRISGLVADTYLPWAVAAGSRRGVPVHSLFPLAASIFSAMYEFDRLAAAVAAADGRVAVNGEGKADEPLAKYIQGHAPLKLADFRSVLAAGKPLELALQALSTVRKADSVLFTSFYELEARVFDALRTNVPVPVYPVGPSIPYMLLDEKRVVVEPGGSAAPDYVEWLDSQPDGSVLYVSLGSFLSVSGAQMDEIAMGLSLSKTRFLWVARSESSRLRETVGDAGLIVPWCDQLRVLGHASVGGFLTHCGWNSTLEGVFSGLPMLTFPIFGDQPIDSRLIVDEWKIGLNLRGGVGMEEGGGVVVVGREEIARVVKRVMDLEGDESKAMRRRAAELREAARRAVEAGGSSSTNLDCFIRDFMGNVAAK